jgi:hypothetical protein
MLFGCFFARFIMPLNPASGISNDQNMSLRPVIVFNRIVDGILSEGKIPVEPNDGQKSSRNRKLLEFLIFAVCSFVVVNERILVFFLNLVQDIIYVLKDILRIPGVSCLNQKQRFYRWWILKFLNPVQQSLFNRTDVYDIDPVSVSCACICAFVKPHFSIL